MRPRRVDVHGDIKARDVRYLFDLRFFCCGLLHKLQVMLGTVDKATHYFWWEPDVEDVVDLREDATEVRQLLNRITCFRKHHISVLRVASAVSDLAKKREGVFIERSTLEMHECTLRAFCRLLIHACTCCKRSGLVTYVPLPPFHRAGPMTCVL